MTIAAKHPYLGEPIIEPDSFLRALPMGVHLEDRIRLDAIVISSDIIVRAFGDLRNTSCQIGREVTQYRSEQLAAIIGACWTIVDQLHACRQLLYQASRKNPGPMMKNFLSASEHVLYLRNQMDHLKDNIGNLAKTKERLGPIYGIVSYLYSGDDIGQCHSVSVGAGALREKMDIYKIDPRGRQVHRPVDHFEFTAFSRTLQIGSVLASLKILMDHTSTSIKDQFEAHLEAVEPKDPISTKNFSSAGTAVITLMETFRID